MRIWDVWDNNIDERSVTRDNRGFNRLQWDICLPTGEIRSVATRGKYLTKGEVKAKARQKAAQIQAEWGSEGTWKRSSNAANYIKVVCIQALRDAPETGKNKISPSTKVVYERILGYLADSFKRLNIAQMCDVLVIERTLNAIAEAHGTTTGEAARKVLNRWVFEQVIHDKLAEHNPLKQMTIRIKVDKKTKAKPTGGVAMSDEEYDRAVDQLLAWADDPSELLVRKPGTTGPMPNEEKRLAAVAITLLQSTTGFRVGECVHLIPEDSEFVNDKLYLTVRPEVSKTKKGRRIPVLDHRVVDALRPLIEKTKKGAYIFANPVKGGLWDPTDCDKAVVRFLREDLAPACDIAALSWPRDENGKRIPKENLRAEQIPQGSHVWRATLNSRAKDAGLSADERAPYFGHSGDVNIEYYTDGNNTTRLEEALMR